MQDLKLAAFYVYSYLNPFEFFGPRGQEKVFESNPTVGKLADHWDSL